MKILLYICALNITSLIMITPSLSQNVDNKRQNVDGMQHNVENTQKAKEKAEVKEQIIALAGDIAQSTPQISNIWPSYWPEDQAFIINIRGQGALLISSDSKPETFTPISVSKLPDSLIGKAYYHDGLLKDVPQPFYFDYDIGNGQSSVLVNVNPSDFESELFLSNIRSLILHEQFHAYQRMTFILKGSGYLKPNDIRDRVSFAVSVHIERQILIDAIKASNKDEKIDYLHRYFAMRRLREETNLTNVAIAERGFERSEGTAEFAERSALTIIAGGDDAMLIELLTEGLQEDLLREGGIFNSVFIRGKSYHNGAALAYLISQYDDGNWQKKIERGVNLDEHLESLIAPIKAANRNDLIAAAHKQYDYDGLYQKFQPIIAERAKQEIKSVDEFFALEPYRVAIDLTAAEGKTSAGFSAIGMFKLGKNLTAITNASIFNAAGDGYSLTSKNHPILFGNKKYIILVPERPKIIGHDEYADGEYRLDGLAISDQGVDIKLTQPVTVLIEANVMTIKLLE